MFGLFRGDFIGDVLGYVIVASILFLPLALFIPYVIYQIAARFPWGETRSTLYEIKDIRAQRRHERLALAGATAHGYHEQTASEDEQRRAA